MASLGSIFVDLIARTGKYSEGLKGAADSTNKFQRSVKNNLSDVGKSFDASAKSILTLNGALAGLLSGAGFTALIKSALDAASKVKDLSDEFNISTDNLQAYQYAAKLTGVSNDQLEAGFAFLSKTIASGKTQYKDLDEALLGLADRVKNAKTGFERTSIAVENFGAKGGQKLLPFLLQGKAGLEGLKNEAKELGVVLNSETIQGAENFGDQLDILGLVIKNNFQEGLLDGFIGDSKTLRDIYSDPSFRDAIKSIGAAFGEVAHFVLQSVNAFNDAKVSIAALFIEFQRFRGTLTDTQADDAFLQLSKKLSENQPALPPPPKQVLVPGGGGIDVDALKKRKDLINDINTSLLDQSLILKQQNNTFGEANALTDLAVKKQEIYNKLSAAHIVLTEQEAKTLDQKLRGLQTELELNDELKAAEEERQKQQKEAEKLEEENRKRLEDSIQTVREDLAGGITDSIFGAKSLGDAFKDVARKIAEAVIQAQLLAAITKASGGSDFGSGLSLGGFFNLFNSFDVGSDYVPYDQLAMVHKGEMIIPAQDAGAMRNGDAGGVTMNIYTPDANSFRASDRQIARQLKSRVATA